MRLFESDLRPGSFMHSVSEGTCLSRPLARSSFLLSINRAFKVGRLSDSGTGSDLVGCKHCFKADIEGLLTLSWVFTAGVSNLLKVD